MNHRPFVKGSCQILDVGITRRLQLCLLIRGKTASYFLFFDYAWIIQTRSEVSTELIIAIGQVNAFIYPWMYTSHLKTCAPGCWAAVRLTNFVLCDCYFPKVMRTLNSAAVWHNLPAILIELSKSKQFNELGPSPPMHNLSIHFKIQSLLRVPIFFDLVWVVEALIWWIFHVNEWLDRVLIQESR